MQTIGQVLKSLRIKNRFTIKDISQETKIDTKLITYLESDQYSFLPSSTFTKGFITSYAKVLNFSPEKALAIFRRDFTVNQSGKILPKGLSKPLDKNTFIASKFFSNTVVALLILAFISYLGFQFKNFNSAPQINITRPKPNTVVRGPLISIKGYVSANSSVYVNGNIADLFPTGEFSANVQLPEGEQFIDIKAIDSQEKISETTIPVIVINN